jgi:hypothetical protein
MKTTLKEDAKDIGMFLVQSVASAGLELARTAVSQIAVVEAQDLAMRSALKDVMENRLKDPAFQELVTMENFVEFLEKTGKYMPKEKAKDYVARMTTGAGL